MATHLGVVLGLEPWVYLENSQAALSHSGKEADFLLVTLGLCVLCPANAFTQGLVFLTTIRVLI